MKTERERNEDRERERERERKYYLPKDFILTSSLSLLLTFIFSVELKELR